MFSYLFYLVQVFPCVTFWLTDLYSVYFLWEKNKSIPNCFSLVFEDEFLVHNLSNGNEFDLQDDVTCKNWPIESGPLQMHRQIRWAAFKKALMISF